MSKLDELTGLLRRNELERYLNSHIKNINVNCYFVLIDLDGFKKINDKYGHDIGDLALKLFSKILIEEINIKSYISRFGGDEFANGLYDIDDQVFNKMFDNLINRLKNEKVPNIEEEVFIGMSAGAIKVDNNLSFKEIYQRADKLMYEAKSIKGTVIKKNF